MNKHTCKDCKYCKVKYFSYSDWSPVITHAVCTANDECPRVDIDREHFCEMYDNTKNPS